MTIGIPLVGTVFTIIIGTLTGMSNLPSFQRHRVLQSLHLISENYDEYVKYRRSLRGRVLYSLIGIFLLLFFLLPISFSHSQYNPVGDISGDLVVIPLFASGVFLAYSNLSVIYYLRKSVLMLLALQKPYDFSANKIARKDRKPTDYGLPDVSYEEAKGNFETWKDAYMNGLWARFAFNYQFIMWGLLLSSLGIYVYAYIGGTLYFYKPVNEAYLNLMLYSVIIFVIILIFIIWRFSKYFNQNFYMLYIVLFIDDPKIEEITFYTSFGEVTGTIEKIGNKLTIQHIVRDKVDKIPVKQRRIAISWKNVLGVSLDKEIDQKLAKATSTFLKDYYKKE